MIRRPPFPETEELIEARAPAAKPFCYSYAMRRVVQFLVVLVVAGALACPFLTPTSSTWWLFGLLYARGLAITVGFHRYFSHRAFHTSRAMQFAPAWIGTSCLQMGPLWWASHHRTHHRTADTPDDPHSPVAHGFWHGYFGWLLDDAVLRPDLSNMRDFLRFPDLVWLDRWPIVPGLLLVGACWLLDGWTGVCYGFCLSTLVLLLVAFSVNAFGHLVGRRRFATDENSRNTFVLGYIAFGDGWHNNPHHYPAAASHGFAWYEFDASYCVIRVLELLGLVWKVRRWPAAIAAEARNDAAPMGATAKLR